MLTAGDMQERTARVAAWCFNELAQLQECRRARQIITTGQNPGDAGRQTRRQTCFILVVQQCGCGGGLAVLWVAAATGGCLLQLRKSQSTNKHKWRCF